MLNEKDRGELLFLIKALSAWLISSLMLCILFSFIVSQTSLDSSYIAYLSSIISLISAIIAGMKAASVKKSSKIYTSIFTAGFLIIFILTTAYLVASGQITTSGLISVISFTFSGVFIGAYIVSSKYYGNKKKRFKKPR